MNKSNKKFVISILNGKRTQNILKNGKKHNYLIKKTVKKLIYQKTVQIYNWDWVD